MKQILLVTRREFLVQVKKKSFILLTLATPLLIVGLGALIAYLSVANAETNHFAVVDNSGLFQTTFKSDKETVYSFYSNAEAQGIKDSISTSESLQGLLIIPKADSDFKNLEKDILLISNKNIGIQQITSLQRKISRRLEFLNLEKKGISKKDLTAAKVPISIQVQKQNENGISDTDETAETVKTVFSTILMYATFMFIMIYGIRVMRSVIEEKNNRVVEIIISSIKPFNLMMGKILGTTLVALTQFAIWIGIILFVMFFFPMLTGLGELPETTTAAMQSAPALEESMNIQIYHIIDILLELNYPLIIVTFLIYFFFGYLLYSSFFAAIGASVDNETETQQFMWIGLMPLMLGMYGSISIINNPDGPVGFWLSIIPFTSPIAMMTRITFGVPIWHLILSIVLLIASVFAMIWLASKIYKIGILMYGGKVNLKEWWKWLRQ